MLHFLFTLAAAADECRSADVMITLDVSGTMQQTTGGQTKYKRAKAAIGAVLDEHQAKADFGLFVFPEPARIVGGEVVDGTGFCNVSTDLAVDFEQNARDSIIGYLDSLTPSGKNDTPIYQALRQVGDPSRWRSDRRKDIILITDGMQDCCRGPFPDEPDEDLDCVSGTTMLDGPEMHDNQQRVADLAWNLKGLGFNIYVVGFGSQVDPVMLALTATAFDPDGPNGDCIDPYSAPGAYRCYYNIDAGSTDELITALDSIVKDIQVEVCNGVDDDCDGVIDENSDESCMNSCGTGIRQCVDGKLSECRVQGAPSGKEICGDGIDNNCDGLIDEVLCPVDEHHCKNGEWVLKCGKDKCEPKNGGMLPVEYCNGTDDDCDGVKDPQSLCECAPNQTKTCNIGPQCPGQQACVSGKWGQCKATAPGEEVCNGADDDCDGQIDEGSNLCPKGSRCVNGECTTGLAVEELGETPDAELEMYRGSGLVRGCSSATPGVWIFMLLPLLRRRRLQ